MKVKLLLLLQACLMFLASCSTEEKEEMLPPSARVVSLRMATLDGSAVGAVDAGKIKELYGYLFENGILTEVFKNLSVAEGGLVKGMSLPDKPEARLYFLANAGNQENIKKLAPGVKEEDFKKLTFTSEPLPEQGAEWLLSGARLVGDLLKDAQTFFFLTRGFARFDVEPAPGVKILDVKMSEVAQSVYVFGQEPVQLPADTSYGRLEKTYETPLAERQDGVFYLYEQKGEKIEVEITADVDGVKNKLKAALPNTIKRNHLYNLKVTLTGTKVELSIQEHSWNTGDIIEATPDLSERITIDMELSELPATVRVSESKDSLFVPHYGETFKLALKSETELEVRLSGLATDDPEVTVTPDTPLTRANERTGAEVIIANAFNVTTRLTSPGSEERYVYLEVRNKNLTEYYGDKIVIVIQKNTTVFSGKIYELFDGKAACIMKEYTDGALGFVEVPTGSTFTCDAEWIKVEKVVPTEPEQPETPETPETRAETIQKERYRILAGYRPNDPEADGRIQNGTFTVQHADGRTEAYPVSRPNNGLPVVLLDGKYWCKFNLKGNARSFDDQIKMNDPAALATDLYEYLKECDDAEYMRLMGDAYKGRTLTGLKLKYTVTDADAGTGTYLYENYASTPAGAVINTADPTKHCPPGYQLPDHNNDILPVFANRNTTFTGTATELTSSFTHGGVRRTAYRYTRSNISYGGGTIPTLYLNKIEFTKDGQENSYALFGTGWQENNTTLNFNFQLFANTVNSNANLVVGEFFSITHRGANFTRAIRCIKTPVEFIY